MSRRKKPWTKRVGYIKSVSIVGQLMKEGRKVIQICVIGRTNQSLEVETWVINRALLGQ